jgi:ankyrin repeat protein
MDYSWKLKCEADQNVCEDYKRYMNQIEGTDKQCSSQKDMCDELNSITINKQKQYLTEILGKNYCEESIIGGEGEFKNMPSDYVYILKQQEFYYCFTFNELEGIIRSNRRPKNPFTRVNFTENEIRDIRNWLNNREGIFVEIDEQVELTPEQQASNDLDSLFELRHVNYPPNYLEFKDKYRTREEIIKMALQLNNIRTEGGGFLFNIPVETILSILNPELNPHVQFINVFNPTRVNDYEKAQILSYFLHKSNEMKEYISDEDRFKNVYYDMYRRFSRKRGHEEIIRWLYDLMGDDFKLIEASKKGDLEDVNRLIDAGADVDAEDGEALISAVHNGHLEIVKRLIEAGADVNINGKALIEASNQKYLDIAIVLIEAGINVNAEEGEALNMAVGNNDLNMVNRLIEAGADVNLGEALIIASRMGLLDIVNRLLEAGASVNNREGEALIMAIKRSQVNIVKRLIEAGADVNLRNGKALNSNIIQRYKLKRKQASQKSIKKTLDILDILIQAGANVNLGNPLIMVSEDGDTVIMKKLIEAGADVNANNGESLILAVWSGNLDSVKLLLISGADVNAQNGQALIDAKETKNKRIIKELIKAGATEML